MQLSVPECIHYATTTITAITTTTIKTNSTTTKSTAKTTPTINTGEKITVSNMDLVGCFFSLGVGTQLLFSVCLLCDIRALFVLKVLHFQCIMALATELLFMNTKFS
jgi:hypothetical protein